MRILSVDLLRVLVEFASGCVIGELLIYLDAFLFPLFDNRHDLLT
jgi:hypothetical protein